MRLMTKELPMIKTGVPMNFRPSEGSWSLNFRQAIPFLTAPTSAAGVRLLTLAIRVYQLTLSPAQIFLFGAAAGCRYTPSCSAYAMEALREHGVAAGTVLAARRICRCHPWGGCGHDPVPKRRARANI
jgi:putative membrane protein insertion efficiency factor